MSHSGEIALDLTARQREIYELRTADPPVPYKEISARLGIGVETIRTTYKTAVKKLKRAEDSPNKVRVVKNSGRRIEAKRPEDVAKFMDKITDPGLRSIIQAGRDCKLSDGVVYELMKRLETEYQPVHRELQRVKTDTLVREFENLGLRALRSIKDEDIEQASAYQRAVIAAISVDKREL